MMTEESRAGRWSALPSSACCRTFGTHRVDVVVVYKIDRLTRSLMDFSKIVEIFDASDVSFVSVTQQFNTTTSMGRLTLNVLLSFAQFEREVTAERIRDKIAASKRKGMWMGGRVPLGYIAKDRTLQIDDIAANKVRWLFERYLELKSVTALAEEINRPASTPTDLGAQAANEVGAASVSRGKLYYLLSNPVYIGKLRHHKQLHDGEHQAIVDPTTFEQVQAASSPASSVPHGPNELRRDLPAHGHTVRRGGASAKPDLLEQSRQAVSVLCVAPSWDITQEGGRGLASSRK